MMTSNNEPEGLPGFFKRIPAEYTWQFVLPVVFFLAALTLFPIKEQFQFDHDEGVELMKALLVNDGYSLYTDIWTDHAPMFTYLLAGVIRTAGYRVGITRLVTLFFASIFIWAYSQYLRLHFGLKIALIGVVLVALLPVFMVRSVSVMIGVPSISLAMIAVLGVSIWQSKRKYIWLVVSAVAMALSISIKIFTGFLAPIIILGLLIYEYQSGGSRIRSLRILLPALIWGLIFTGVTFLWVYWMVGLENAFQLIAPHLGGEELNLAGQTINHHLQTQLPLFILAASGAIISVRKKNDFFFYPFAWMITAYVLLLFHKPVWEHLQLLVTIPAAMLAALGVAEVVDRLPAWGAITAFFRRQPWAFAIGLFALIFLILDFHVPAGFELIRKPFQERDQLLLISPSEGRLLSDVSNFAPETTWMVTDKPMFAFVNRLKTPPNLAVMSIKRLLTGNLTEDEIIQTIGEYRPEQVLLGRIPYPRVEAFLDADYTLYRQEETDSHPIKLFLRNDMLP